MPFPNLLQIQIGKTANTTSITPIKSRCVVAIFPDQALLVDRVQLIALTNGSRQQMSALIFIFTHRTKEYEPQSSADHQLHLVGRR